MTASRSKTKCKNIVQSLMTRTTGSISRDSHLIMRQYAEDFCAHSTSHKRCNLPNSLRTTFVLAFSCNNQWIASAHGDHTIRVCDIHSGQCFQTLSGHRRTPWTLAWHPNITNILASGCLGGQVRVWNLQGNSETYCVDDGTVINSIAFSPKVSYMLFITTCDKLILWDWRQPAPCITVGTAHSLEKIRLIKFHPTGDFLLTAITNLPIDGLKRRSQTSSGNRTEHQTASIIQHITATVEDNSTEVNSQTGSNSNVFRNQENRQHSGAINDRASGENSEEIIMSAVTISATSTGTPRIATSVPTVISNPTIQGERTVGPSITQMINAGGSIFHVSVGTTNGSGDQAPILTARIKMRRITNRLQWWDISSGCLPNLQEDEKSILLRNAVIHNDMSCAFTKDCSLLAALAYERNDSCNGISLTLISVNSSSMGQIVFKRAFGPNIMSVSFSPLDRYIIAAFSCHRLHMHDFTGSPVASVYKICKDDGKNLTGTSPNCDSQSEIDLELIRDIGHYQYESNSDFVSANIACWLPEIGCGLVYGTNKGHVIISHT